MITLFLRNFMIYPLDRPWGTIYHPDLRMSNETFKKIKKIVIQESALKMFALSPRPCPRRLGIPPEKLPGGKRPEA
jgi:hypothetical protein